MRILILCLFTASTLSAQAYYESTTLYSDGWRLRDSRGRTVYRNLSTDYDNPVWGRSHYYEEQLEREIREELEKKYSDKGN